MTHTNVTLKVAAITFGGALIPQTHSEKRSRASGLPVWPHARAREKNARGRAAAATEAAAAAPLPPPLPPAPLRRLSLPQGSGQAG